MNITTQAKKKMLSGFTIVAILLFGIAIFNNGRSITGPFIFGDELEYFSYARDIFMGADLSSHTQYGIFYPALASLFFNFGDTNITYQYLRVFNIAILISSAIPSFLLARALLPNSPFAFLFSVFVVTAPFSGFVYLTWAEPLYYLLFLWTAFTLLRFYKKQELTLAPACGILLALLFHTKPGAGIIVQFAAVISLAVLVYTTPAISRKKVFYSVLVLGLFCAALTIPWMLRNLSLGVGIIGYNSHSVELAKIIAKFGYTHFAADVAHSILFQLAYVFIGTWGLLGILFVLPIMRWETYSTELRAFIAFTIACLAGLIALSAFGVSGHSGLGYWIPNGRYYSAISPVPILLSLYLLTQRPTVGRNEMYSLVLVTVVLMVVSIFATPLRVIMPYSFVNNPELALPTWIIDSGKIVWRGGYNPTILESISLGGVIGSIGLVLILISKWKRIFAACMLLVFIFSFFSSLVEHKYVKGIGMSPAAINNVVSFINHKYPQDKGVVFDRVLNVDFIMNYWMPGVRPEYLNPSEIANCSGTSKQVFFVTTQSLPYPVAYSSNDLIVYEGCRATP